MNFTKRKVDYDDQYDILYCSFSDASNSYGDELDKNVVILRDMDSDGVTGVTIYGFKKHYEPDKSKQEKLKQYLKMPHLVIA